MGLYATTTSIYGLLIGTEEDSTTTLLLTKKISLAENTVKSRLSKRYDVSAFDSATAIPPQLTDLTETLTEGYYYKSASRGNEKMLKRGETLCKYVLSELKLISDGDVNLLDTSGSSIVERDSGQWDMTSSTMDYTPTFAEDSADNWRIDPDKLTDIETNRG